MSPIHTAPTQTLKPSTTHCPGVKARGSNVQGEKVRTTDTPSLSRRSQVRPCLSPSLGGVSSPPCSVGPMNELCAEHDKPSTPGTMAAGMQEPRAFRSSTRSLHEDRGERESAIFVRFLSITKPCSCRQRHWLTVGCCLSQDLTFNHGRS